MTWIFIPSNCLPASASLAKDCEPGSLTWAERLAPSLTLNGKLTRPASWRLACKKAAWMQHLSGATSPPLTHTSGLGPWIASLRDSRAKTCLLQADALGLTESAAGCFLKSPALPVIAVRDTSFWRTLGASLLPPPPLWTKPKALLTNAQPPASWENWPTSGGMRNGQLFQRPTLEPATGVRGGFAGHGETWLTPRATDTNNSESSETFVKRMGDRGSHCSGSLAAQASRYWTTPDVCSGARDMSKIDPEAQKRANTKRTTGLPTEAQNWATPQARDHKNPDKPESGNFQRKLQQGYTIDLNSQTAAWESSHQAQPTQPGPESSSNGPTSPRRLNPAFTEWLMGWPTGWTIAAPSASSAAATESWRHKLALHLSDLCGE